jgi:hypothetical protein
MAFKYTSCTTFGEPDCDSDYYLVVAKDRERLSVNKRVAQKFDKDTFNLRKLNEVKVRGQ